MSTGIQRAICLVVLGTAALALYACEDDPILPPGESEPDDGGSYSQMRLDVEPVFGEPSDSAAALRDSVQEGEPSRAANPTLF